MFYLVFLYFLSSLVGKHNSDITPKIEEYGSNIGGAMGGIVFDSFASGFSDSVTKTFTLKHTPINKHSVVVSMVTVPSTNTSIRNVFVDLENKQISVTLTYVTGSVRFCACYPTLDDLTA